MLESKNIIIIGGNAAGPAAAAKAKRVSPESNVLLFEAGNFMSTGTCELPYVLSGEIKNYEDIVFYNPESFEKEKGVKIFTNHRVEKLNRKQKTITVRNLLLNHVFEQSYDKLILATGSRIKINPSLFPFPKNVFSLKSVRDLISIQDYIQTNRVRNVLIIGAGYIGLETAEAFKKLGLNVTISEKEILPMPGTDKEIRNMIAENLKQNGVEFFGNSGELKFVFENGKVISANIRGRIINFDIIINSIGVEPNNDLAVAANLEIGKYGGLKVDNKLRTSDQNIFAAGDNIEVVNKITNKSEFIPVAALAHKCGHIAGENAAGGNAFINPVIKNIAVKIFDKCLVTVGINSDEATKNRFNCLSVSAIEKNLVKVMPASQNVFGKIIFEKNSYNILGAQFLGGKEVIGYADLIASFIQNKIKATELENINYNYTPPLSPFMNLLSVLGKKIKREK
jgi:NADPH-dependent 2,4-dienoyl-CoA reductase/sulfur reductase-like enzyme